MILLDTDVMVDIRREFPPALRWFDSLKEPPVLSGHVVMELIAGCKNKGELESVQKAIGKFTIFWPNSEQCGKALTDLERFHLSHKLDPNDALIGELAVGLGTILYTFNEKHFSLIPGLKTRKPYARRIK